MNYELLGNIVEVSKGKKHNTIETPGINSKRIIGINDLRNDTVIVFTDDTKGIEAYEKDILIAWDGANAGTIGYGKRGYIGSTIARLRFKEPKKNNVTFHGKLLQSKFDYLRSTATGATIPHINRAALDRIKVPKFNLTDQIRIATVLTRAEKLIAKRKESIQALDELLKSTFLEMFGDPVRNEKGWEKIDFGSISDEFKYGTNTISDNIESENKIPILRIPNIIGEKINYSDLKYSIIDEKEKAKIRLEKDDLLFVRTNGNPAYIGRCAVFSDPIECGYASYLIRVRLKNTSPVSANFIKSVISFPTYRHIVISKAKTTAGNYNINTKSLKSLMIYLPPIELQNQFAAIVEKVESIKSCYQQSLTGLENLYGSLSQRAFKGELDLSKVPLGKEEQIIELHDEAQGVSDITVELSAARQYSETELIRIIQSMSGKTFSFDSLMTELEKASFEEMPEYEELKNQIYKMLDGTKPLLSQTFDKEKKEIVVSVNR